MTRDDSGKAAAFGVRWLATALGWEGFARQFGQSSPKGSNSTAQGEALGFGMQTANSPERASLAASFAPSGLNRCCVARSPRALPWADELRPFGVQNGIGGQSSPKGSNSTAQGEALGFGMQTANSPERASLAASL